ncbi:hypothetical protein M9Y10_003854 [Tritrichomonas musculus]|uniref:Uncharacterized protein n=1 Tax=Tritrichomonas musculus TaxID=1915356 RepID=A0ABR2JQS6_9EUKA
MSEKAEVADTEQLEEIKSEHPAISLDVEVGKPVQLDFSNAPKVDGDELMTAIIFLVNRNESEKGPLTIKVKYSDVESYEGNVNDNKIVVKEEVVATFGENDFDQKEVQYTFTEDHGAEFSAEGIGSCNIIGYFASLNDDEEEEEEEEEAKEEKAE